MRAVFLLTHVKHILWGDVGGEASQWGLAPTPAPAAASPVGAIWRVQGNVSVPG